MPRAFTNTPFFVCIFALAAVLQAFAPHLAAVEADAGQPRSQTPLASRGILVAGAASDSYPHAYIGPNGRWAGYSAEMLDAVARVMGLRINRVSAPAAEVQERFRNGEFDLMQTLSQTPEREDYAEFSVPFLTLQGAVFVQKHSSRIRTIRDLEGQKFAVIGRNSIGERFLSDQGLRVQVEYVSSVADAVQLVQDGLCAGTFASQLTALAVIDRAGLNNVAMLGAPIPDYDIRHCFAVHKGDAQLLARLNEGLAILNSSGESQTIYDRWFGHLDSGMISTRIVIRYALLAAFVIATIVLIAWFYQRLLRRLIARQTREIAGQKSLLQALYDNIPMAICLLQRETGGFRILSTNRQAEPWIGLPATSVVGNRLDAILHRSEWLDMLRGLLAAHADRNELLREEFLLKGSRKRIIFTLLPMAPDASGRQRLCILSEDVTERRTLDEEISQTRRLRAIGELVGGIAHEFNNLLTPITLKAGEIQLEWPGDRRLHEELRPIADSAQRAADLTRRLLAFGRKAENRIEDIRLQSAVSACHALLKLTVDRRIEWDINIPANLPPLRFSVTDLNQIILNLVLNARDTLLEKLSSRAPDGWRPTIRIEARVLPAKSVTRVDPATVSRHQILGWQQLTVRDNGMGMADDVRERIFEPFYTTKAVGKGTGLGLATVWHLVTGASGRIEVESTPGEGTAFHVYLPELPASDTATPAPAAPKIPRTSAPARVFLAEDDDLVASATITALRRARHAVVHQRDGSEAWSHLKNNPGAYDLLMLDVNMPGMDGIEITRRVREAGGYKGAILVLSGRITSEDMHQLTALKVDCVLNKPFDIAELLEAVNTCIKSHQS